jgi:flagellar motor switch protein FliM
MSQILSQEEIDALLSAMSKGEVDLKRGRKKEPKVASYDLTSKEIMLREQLVGLEVILDRFANLLHSSLTTSFRRVIEADFTSTEVVKFREFLSTFSHPTSFGVFRIAPLSGSALIAIEPHLAFSLIDCMFGGKGKSINKIREFTLIEQRVMRKLIIDMLKNLEKAWGVVHSCSLSLKRTETDPRFVQLAPLNDWVISATLYIQEEEFSGNIHLCFPYLMLEPIKGKLSSKELREAEVEHGLGSQIQDLLRYTQITITAELGRTTLALRDLLSLQVGDVLKLNTGPQDHVIINVEGIPKYQGLPGVIKGNRAVQITLLLGQKGGKKNHG